MAGIRRLEAKITRDRARLELQYGSGLVPQSWPEAEVRGLEVALGREGPVGRSAGVEAQQGLPCVKSALAPADAERLVTLLGHVDDRRIQSR